MKSRKLGITAQSIVLICALLLLVNVILGSVLLTRSKTLLKTLINDRMLDISNTAADMLDGDSLYGITEDSPGTPAYQAVYDALKVFQDNINLEFIYAVRPVDDRTFIFIVDPHETDPGPYGETIQVTDALLSAYHGVPAADSEPYQDRWGKFYSSYSPVFDASGKVSGIVCVDFRADWYEEQLSRNTMTVLLFSVFSLLIGASVVTLLNTRLRNRLRAFNADLGELTCDVDTLLREIDVGAKQSGDAEPGDVADEMTELGKRIHSIRDALRRYIDYAHSEANSMITALASDYQSVYYVDLDSGEGVCYRVHGQIEGGLYEGERFLYRETLTEYARRYVAEGDREEFLRFTDADSIRRGLQQESVIAHRYLVVRNGQESYEMMRIAGVNAVEDGVHAVSVGFADVDRETREALRQRQTLSDALAVAEESNRAKTAFLSSMSHEIRTPMNAIIGLDSIALNDPGISVKTRDYLEKIGASARHLLGLINDVLDMSRIESGRMTLKNEEFSFRKFLEQVNAITESQCREKGLRYDCQIRGGLSDRYIGDDMKLRQIIINILGNSVKFTPKGGAVTLSVERVARYEGKSTLRFTMSDTGIGMDKAFLPKLFDAFSQEDSSTTTRYGSTGLGMAITKNMVELMNGKISVESEKGVGTTFTVTVTLRESDRQEARPEGLTALVVDDDPIARDAAKLTLEQAGIASELAASGAEAVEMVRLRYARRERYDLILVDWKDGVETTRQIRAVPGVGAVILILSAYNRDDALDEAVSAGADGFLSKPLSAADALEALQTARGNTESRKADLKGRRILLAEDMEINAEIMTELLKMREMSVDRAENGKIAVELFASRPENFYDAILMDMRMPEMDGLEAASTIRALDRADAKTVPVIALTANAFDEDVQRSLQAGLNAHLSKPVEPENLFATLESLIR